MNGRGSTGLRVAVLALLLVLTFVPQAYAITTPSNIVAYVPITLQNNDANVIASGTQLEIFFPAGSYTSYEMSNMVNGEFFYSNGMVIKSWLEGNVANELVQTSL